MSTQVDFRAYFLLLAWTLCLQSHCGLALHLKGAASALHALPSTVPSSTSPPSVPILPSPDEAALVAFANSITADKLGTLKDWKAGTLCISWSHVTCDIHNRVTSLDLSSKYLAGQIPDALGELQFLQALNLRNNLFSGTIPAALGNLTSLANLDLARNNLTGVLPETLGRLKNLRFLDVSSNALSEAIPAAVLSLPDMYYFDLSSNNFSGFITKEVHFRLTTYHNKHLSVACNNCIDESKSQLTAQSGTSKKAHRRVAIISATVGAAAGVILAVVCVFIFCLWRRQTSEKQLKAQDAVKDPSLSKSVGKTPSSLSMFSGNNIRNFSLKELKAATGNFNPENQIGFGGFGTVYKAILPSSEILAVKRAHRESHQGHNEFHNEVEVLSRIYHKNLVNLVGFCEEKGEQILVYEYVPNGNLFEHISGRMGQTLAWRQRLGIAICAAKGIAYLHDECSPSIIHRDLKPSNILLDHKYHAKVSDFGISKMGPMDNATHVSTGVKGTPGYVDPYYYCNSRIGTFCDVYSFGVIILQLITSKPACDRSRKQAAYNIINWVRPSIESGQLEVILDPDLQSQPYNRDILLQMAEVGLRCVGKDIKERPSMSQIYQELELALQMIDGPPSDPPSASLSQRHESRLSHTQGSASFNDGEAQTGRSSDSEFSLPELGGKDFHIKFDGMEWIDIKELDVESLQDISTNLKEYYKSIPDPKN